MLCPTITTGLGMSAARRVASNAVAARCAVIIGAPVEAPVPG